MSAKPVLAFILTAALTACGDSKEGTSISINASGTDGNVVAGIDKTGQVAFNLPGGFAGNIKLPKLKLNAEDFDMNGVKLFPGSTISGMNIDARDGGTGKDSGIIRVQFESPATPEKVRAWFLDKLSREAGFTVQASGQGLAGTTDEKQPFRLDLAPVGSGRSSGTIVIG